MGKPDIISITGLLVRKGIEPDLAAEIAEELAEDWEFLSQEKDKNKPAKSSTTPTSSQNGQE